MLVRNTSIERLGQMLLANRIGYILRHTDAQIESVLRPIRYPLYRGLIGWRVFAVQGDQPQRFHKINSHKELKSLKERVGYNWPDVGVLDYSIFETRSGKDHLSLYTSLELGRFGFHSRRWLAPLINNLTLKKEA